MAAEEQLILRMRAEGGTAVAAEVEGASKSVGHLHEQASKAHGSTTLLSRAFGSLKSVIGTGFAVAGVGAVGFELGEMVKNAQMFQSQSAQLGTAIRANVKFPAEEAGGALSELGHRLGTSFRAPNVAPAQEALKSMVEFAESLSTRGGFVPTEEIAGLTQLLRVTHDTSKAQRDLTLATNISRGAHRDLSQSVRAVMMVEGGRLGMLTRLGIILPKHTTATQAMTILQQRYAGATAAYNRTAEGAIGNFKNAIDILGEHVGMILTPALTKAFTWLSHFLDQVIHGEGAGRYFHDALVMVGSALSQVWTYLKAAYGVAMDVVRAFQQNRAWAVFLVGALAGLAAALITFRALAIAATIATRVWAIATGLLNAVLRANPIVLVITLIAMLVGAFIMAYNRVKWFRDGVNAAWAWIKNAALDAVHWIIHAWNDMVNFISSLPGRVSHAATGLWNGLKAGLIDAVNWIIDKINAVIKAYNSVAGSIPIFGGSLTVGTINPLAGPGVPATGGPAGNSTIGHRQAGGPIAYSGMYRVGESGPEDIYLPSGGHVVPATPGEAHILEGTIINHIDGREVGRSLVRVGLQDKARQ